MGRGGAEPPLTLTYFGDLLAETCKVYNNPGRFFLDSRFSPYALRASEKQARE